MCPEGCSQEGESQERVEGEGISGRNLLLFPVASLLVDAFDSQPLLVLESNFVARNTV